MLTCLTTPHAELYAQFDEGILTLALNRPERKNALTGPLYLALEQALIEADKTPEVHVVLLRGLADDFSAGNDLNDFVTSKQSIDAPPFRLLHAAAAFTKPLIIAIKGVAIGIGTTLLLHADLAYCDNSARFQLPFVSLGLSPEGASSLLLPVRAGYLQAAELLMLAEPFNAQKALRAGLVNDIIEGDVYAHALQKAQRLVSLPAQSLATTKQLMQQNGVAERIDEEAAVFVQRTQSPEMREALTAFKEKRPPNFRQFD